MATYRYVGPAYRFNVCVLDEADITTQATSLRQAVSNIRYRIKKYLGLSRGSALDILEENVRLVQTDKPAVKSKPETQSEDRQLSLDDAMKNIKGDTYMRKFVKQPKGIKSAKTTDPDKEWERFTADPGDLSVWAEKIADDLADFLNETGRMEDREYYLADEDMGTLGDCYDCLMDFAQVYDHGNARKRKELKK